MEEKERISEYIPENLYDCFKELKILISGENYFLFFNKLEEDLCLYHDNLGRSMRNKWGLWSGSRLSRWFNKIGIQHPDDMSSIIIDSFWREIHSKPIRLKEQVKKYQDYWRNYYGSQN